jgi:hypothetical protein
MKPPLEIMLYKAPASMGRSKGGKTLWATDKHGPWVEVEPAAKTYLESLGWDVDYGVMYNVRNITNAALFTIYAAEKNPPTSKSLLSSGQQVNRVDGISGHMFDTKDKEAFQKVQEIFKARGIDLEGPLQFLKLVIFCSNEYTDMSVNTEELFFTRIRKYLDENLIDSYQLVFEKWIRIYTKKVRKSDIAKGFRFRDDDHVLLRLERFIRTQEKIDFSAYAASANAAELNYRLKLYKRENRDHHNMFNRGRKISKPERIPGNDQEILASDRFKERYGSFLRAVSIEGKTIAKWQRLIANIGMENIFKFLISDGEKWSRTQTWHSAGEPDLFISKNGCSYFCEVKSPNDRIHQSQRDFMEYVAKGSGIDYIVCKVKPSV